MFGVCKSNASIHLKIKVRGYETSHTLVLSSCTLKRISISILDNRANRKPLSYNSTGRQNLIIVKNEVRGISRTTKIVAAHWFVVEAAILEPGNTIMVGRPVPVLPAAPAQLNSRTGLLQIFMIRLPSA